MQLGSGCSRGLTASRKEALTNATQTVVEKGTRAGETSTGHLIFRAVVGFSEKAKILLSSIRSIAELHHTFKNPTTNSLP